MQRVRIKGIAAFQSTPPEYMRDMLRHDDGKIEAIWDYPTGKRFESVPFTAIVQLNEYTPDRWRSFGLYPDVLGDVGEYSAQGYTVDEWVADRSPVQEPEATADVIHAPEVTYQYVIHCEDCGTLCINSENCNPDESEQFDTVTYNLADARKGIAAHKRYHKASN
jgi:hypothetical protein